MEHNISRLYIKEYSNNNLKQIEYSIKLKHIKKYEIQTILNFAVHLFNYYYSKKIDGSFSISTKIYNNRREIFFSNFDNTEYMKQAVFACDYTTVLPFEILSIEINIYKKNRIKDYYTLLNKIFGSNIANKYY